MPTVKKSNGKNIRGNHINFNLRIEYKFEIGTNITNGTLYIRFCC